MSAVIGSKLIIETKIDRQLRSFLSYSGIDRSYVYQILKYSHLVCEKTCAILMPDGVLAFDSRLLSAYAFFLETQICEHIKIIMSNSHTPFDYPDIRVTLFQTQEERDGRQAIVLCLFVYLQDTRDDYPFPHFVSCAEENDILYH